MLLNTRRRMLGLLAAAIGAPRLVQLIPSAFAAETEQKPASKKPECFALQAFGDWKGTVTNTQAGARIGQDGFGYLPSPKGHQKIPQARRVIVQDDVEIGANTTIDRGRFVAAHAGLRHGHQAGRFVGFLR